MAMGFDVDDHHEPRSTPKLTLSKIPYCKPTRHPTHMRTPPPRSPVSIPFRWEEAPGKPRAASGEAEDGRCLDLPPRLKPLYDDDSDFTVMPSPTTVLDGPYVGRSLSLACTFSFRRGLVAGREDGTRPSKKSGGGKVGSRRWGSFRDEKKMDRGNLDFSYSLGDLFSCEKNVKEARARKRKGLFGNLLWGGMYASLKRAVPVPVPWRSRAQPVKVKKECSDEM